MTKTPNLNLHLPDFNNSPWHDEVNNNFRSIDAVIKSIFGLTSLLGSYQNSTAVTTSQRYFDETTGYYYEALSAFTTMASPNTFATERSTYPARWKLLDASEAFTAASDAETAAAAALVSQNAAATSASNAATSETNAANVVSASVVGAVRHDIVQSLSAGQQGQARANIGISADILGGFRNKIINALGTINQRSYVSGAATSGANQYTIDRWRVVTSGQNLAWTESEGVRTMTAPAGGVEQIIEGSCILTGDHVLSWTGTATATVNGVARTNGEVFALTGGSNVTIRFSNGTFSKPQLEMSSSATEFAQRHIQQELALCQRYYEIGGGWSDLGCVIATTSGQEFYHTMRFLVEKRAVPAIVLGTSASGYVSGSNQVGTVSTRSFYLANSSNRAGLVWIGNEFAADAEL